MAEADAATAGVAVAAVVVAVVGPVATALLSATLAGKGHTIIE